MNFYPEKMIHYRLKNHAEPMDYPKENALLVILCLTSAILTLISLFVLLLKK